MTGPMPSTDAEAPASTSRSPHRTLARSEAAPPVRIVHLGLGAFARSHQAWYTAMVDDHHEWGIAAFTGRSATVAQQLQPQQGLYTLVTRSAEGDSVEVVSSVSEVVDGARVDRLIELISAAQTALVTLTVTESGYCALADGAPDPEHPAVARDIELLRSAQTAEDDHPSTALGRLVMGLAARRRAESGGLAIVPCDNMPDNGEFVRRGVVGLAEKVDPALADWIESEVSFVSTSVDRITPRTTAEDVETVRRLTGYADAAPVVTEPFHDWILSGRFPAGRPNWEAAGARFVSDIEPYERRKLWLLNGAHSLLAYAGIVRGHETVAEAIADPRCRAAASAFWDEAGRHLPAELDLEEYRAALLARFANVRIAHRLRQIAAEGVTKLAVRIAPVALAERAAGRTAEASARIIGAWAAFVRSGESIDDVRADAVAVARRSADPDRALLALIDAGLAADDDFASLVSTAAHEWQHRDCRPEEEE